MKDDKFANSTIRMLKKILTEKGTVAFPEQENNKTSCYVISRQGQEIARIKTHFFRGGNDIHIIELLIDGKVVASTDQHKSDDQGYTIYFLNKPIKSRVFKRLNALLEQAKALYLEQARVEALKSLKKPKESKRTLKKSKNTDQIKTLAFLKQFQK